MKIYKSLLPEITLKYKTGDQKKAKISNDLDAYKVIKDCFNTDTIELCETFIVLYLNNANNTIGWMKLAQGGLNGVIVDIRLIFSTALKCAASSIIVAHNHPSGNLDISKSDMNITRKIKNAGEILDIALTDHLVITKRGYTSFTNKGIL